MQRTRDSAALGPTTKFIGKIFSDLALIRAHLNTMYNNGCFSFLAKNAQFDYVYIFNAHFVLTLIYLSTTLIFHIDKVISNIFQTRKPTAILSQTRIMYKVICEITSFSYVTLISTNKVGNNSRTHLLGLSIRDAAISTSLARFGCEPTNHTDSIFYKFESDLIYDLPFSRLRFGENSNINH